MNVCNKRLKIHFKGIRGKIQNVKLETEKEKSNWEQSVTVLFPSDSVDAGSLNVMWACCSPIGQNNTKDFFYPIRGQYSKSCSHWSYHSTTPSEWATHFLSNFSLHLAVTFWLSHAPPLTTPGSLRKGLL